ncbi:Gfo/Idh/MocA family oxidoreductase [Planococcus sp. APC 4015]|nr:Gfo/Idh/MocA family oxidoreductase [Planococcus sp. APC 4015]
MTTDSSPVRVAVIGTSVISGSFAAAVAAADGIRIEAVYSRDAERAADAAARFGAEWSSDSLDEVLGSPEVDAVYIASPNSVHAEQVAAAIAAGKHVLVEKPAVLHAREWRELVVQARAAGVVLLEAMRTEYDPGTALVRSLLPRLGTVRMASLRYAKRSSRYDQVLAGERVNMFDPALGGGALADLGVYCLHAMVSLFGMPDRLTAAVVPVASGVEGAGTVTAAYPGLVVDLSYSKISTSQLGSEIQGEDSTLVIDLIAAPRVVTLVAADGTTERHEVPGDPHPLAGEIDRFVDLIATGGDAGADQLLTEQTLELVERARSAAA